jgi:hypothetical protein
MSSRPFAAELKPDPVLRKIVLLSGCLATLTGIVLAMRLPAPVPARIFLVLAWACVSVYEIGRTTQGVRRTKTILLAPDEAVVLDRAGRSERVRIMSGSVVLPGVAWLRLGFDDGLTYGELLRGNAARCPHWRHLQILWRQGLESFGRPGIS